MTELHNIFAVLKAMDKHIKNSGSDSMFIEAGTDIITTMQQIKSGKPLKSSSWSHKILFVIEIIFVNCYIMRYANCICKK